MPGWVSALAQGAVRQGDGWWRALRRRPAARVFADGHQVELLTFRSHVRGDRLRVRGRLVLDRQLLPSEELTETSQRVRSMLRRYLVREVVGARVQARHGEGAVEGETDEGGFFDLELPTPVERGPRLRWEEVDVSVPDREGLRTRAQVQVPGTHGTLAIVSDVDDTVVRTRADRIVTQVQTVLSQTPATRTALPGAAALYRALQERHDAPIWYLSSAAWNLHDYFEEVFDRVGLPPGAMELREFGAGAVAPDRHRNHKKARLEEILEQADDLPVLLVGDSGQADARIYAEVVRERSDRIRAVVIRDVGDPLRARHVTELLEETEAATGVPLRLVPDSESMAELLIAEDLMQPEVRPRVRA